MSNSVLGVGIDAKLTRIISLLGNIDAKVRDLALVGRKVFCLTNLETLLLDTDLVLDKLNRSNQEVLQDHQS